MSEHGGHGGGGHGGGDAGLFPDAQSFELARDAWGDFVRTVGPQTILDVLINPVLGGQPAGKPTGHH